MEFKCILAGYLGKTLAQLDDMTAVEFRVWQEFFRRRPFGDTRYFLAMIATALMNANQGEGAKALDLDEVMRSCPTPPPEDKPKRDEQPIEEMKAFGDAIVVALGGAL